MRLLFLILALHCSGTLRASHPSDTAINRIVADLERACKDVRCSYQKRMVALTGQLQGVRSQLSNTGTSLEAKVNLLVAKDSLEEVMLLTRELEVNDISKIRYRKGLQIIKILYEKVLSLDHHFSAVRTFNEISNLSNPNQYPEFQRIKDMLQNQSDKKKGFELTEILEKNIYTSVVSSLFRLFSSGKDRSEKNTDLKNIECVIDFTLQIHQDLKTIFYETSFLQQSNAGIKLNIEQLFRDYTKPIRYESALEDCRNKDDWDMIDDLLDVYMKRMNEVSGPSARDQGAKANKMQVNLEFQIDRLLQFIALYNNFIDQGEKYYEKFKLVLNNYSNAKPCAGVIPPAYQKLIDDVDIAISKFKTAYKPVEVNGSKLKELLYGINEGVE